ncbi:MAG: thiaminase II [Candidatus Caldarchaeum sp.]
MTAFRDKLWQGVADIYSSILAHPFITGLTDGSLDMKVFRGYVIQDALYLSRFSRALAVLGAKAPDDEASLTLVSASHGALAVERASLHEFLFREWGISVSEIKEYQISPITRAYTDFLTACVYDKPFLTSLSAVLPCFWIYSEVGKELLKKGSPVELYRRWINTYSSPEYERMVNAVLDLTDTVAVDVAEHHLEEAKLYFRLSTIYEYLFWDYAYRGVGWPFKPTP